MVVLIILGALLQLVGCVLPWLAGPPFNFIVLILSAGLEYALSQALTLRAGLAFDFRFNGRYLKVREVTVLKKEETPQVKAIIVVKRRKGKYIPPANHPWRRHNPALHHNCYLERI